LYGIAVNRCRASLRVRDVLHGLGLPEDSPAVPVAAGPGPADSAIATETAALVTTAVALLPPQQRAVVVLRIWQGMSYAEIAEIRGRREGTGRSHMHHGLAALRKSLEPRLQ